MRVALCPRCDAMHAPSGVTFDPARGLVTWPGGRMRLPPAPGKVFGLLFRRAGLVVRREALLVEVYDGEDGGPLSALSIIGICILRIRKEMKASGFPGEIRNIYRRGYELILHPVAQQQSAEVAA